MIKENSFITKIIPSNIDFYGWEKDYKENCDIEGQGYVEWEFYVEYRSYGVKSISVYATNVEINYTISRWMDDGDDFDFNREAPLKPYIETSGIDTKLPSFDKWELESNSDEIEFGHCIEPQNVEVDFDSKVITITF